MKLSDASWKECPSAWRAPFLPASGPVWSTFLALEELFEYNGSGVMPGRTWVIAPDVESLKRRWNKLILAPADQRDTLFHPHILEGKLGDKHANKVVKGPLAGFISRPKSIAMEDGECNAPERYAFRSFDRQWIIPDSRLINRPNPQLWAMQSNHQVFLTALSRTSPTTGPALTLTCLVPDLDHYKGRGGRVFPLWMDGKGEVSNILAGVLAYLNKKYARTVTPEDMFAYITAVSAHRNFAERFKKDLSTPGLRIPLTADVSLFCEAVDVGRIVVWLHTFGERMADPASGRPNGPPRLPSERRPFIPPDGAISQAPELMPDAIDFDASRQRLKIGNGHIDNVSAAVWNYEVSGKKVIRHWFSYRKKNRERPVIGDRRKPSPLAVVQPDHWLAEYTSELINVLNILGWLVELEPAQAALLGKIVDGPLIGTEELREVGALHASTQSKRTSKSVPGPRLFG